MSVVISRLHCCQAAEPVHHFSNNRQGLVTKQHGSSRTSRSLSPLIEGIFLCHLYLVPSKLRPRAKSGKSPTNRRKASCTRLLGLENVRSKPPSDTCHKPFSDNSSSRTDLHTAQKGKGEKNGAAAYSCLHLPQGSNSLPSLLWATC